MHFHRPRHKKIKRLLFWGLLLLVLLFGVSQISATPPNASLTPLIISEFMATNGTGLTDEDGDYVDWIEIYNKSGQPVNLGGWALTNDPATPSRWMFPDITLGSREYLVVFASGKNRQGTEPGTALHTNFRLSKAGGYLGLFNVLEARIMDELAPVYPQQFRDVSYGRYGDTLSYGYLAIATPGGPNDDTLAWADIVAPVTFSQARGFYDSPLEVSLTTVTPNATIRYTTDGSEPTSSRGRPYTEPLTIDTTTTLRAAAFHPDSLPAPVTTHTYIFPDDVLAQPDEPPGFPRTWGTRLAEVDGRVEVAAVPADYGLAPPAGTGSADLGDSLSALPTLSLVMDRQSFAELHANFEDASIWEQPVSVEWIEPDGRSADFQINAGIRPYAATADSAASPKRSFRLLFKGAYGATKLTYPVFDTSSLASFDTLLLLAGPDGSLAHPETSGVTYARTEWLRRSQEAMSGLAAHGTFVHLYLNGLYWGLYNLAERPDESFMAAYLGSDKEDWFIATEDGPQHGAEDARAAELAYLFTILDFAARSDTGPTRPAYLAEPYADLAAYFDPVQFSDYMILNWYAGTDQWAGHHWSAGVRLQEIAGRGHIFVADTYRIFQGHGPTLGFDRGDTGSSPQTGLIQPLFETMLQDPDFRMTLADRLYKHLFNDGALSETEATARWQTLVHTLDPAIPAEAARWGDAARQPPLTPQDWREATEAVLAQLDGNATRLIEQAREAGFYPPVDPPLFSRDGGLVQAGFEIEMALPEGCQDCTIYYTVNGSDPRLPVTGDLLPTANVYEQPIVLETNASLKARLLQGDPTAPAERLVWSALHEATFTVLAEDNKLRITEIMYNPSGGDDYEFIELKNSGAAPVRLAGLFLDDGIRFLFPPDTPPLGPGQFAVLVGNPTAFAERYPEVEIAGVYDGSLSNKGETVGLFTQDARLLFSVTYNDATGWPVSADGRGDSLTLVDVEGDPNDARSWQASPTLLGSPGR